MVDVSFLRYKLRTKKKLTIYYLALYKPSTGKRISRPLQQMYNQHTSLVVEEV